MGSFRSESQRRAVMAKLNPYTKIRKASDTTRAKEGYHVFYGREGQPNFDGVEYFEKKRDAKKFSKVYNKGMKEFKKAYEKTGSMGEGIKKIEEVKKEVETNA